MKFKRTAFLMAVVVTVGLLLGTSAAQAAEVIFDPDNPTRATGITNLDIGGTAYNVAFISQTTAQLLYGDVPGVFDFSNSASASAAVDAVNVELNAEGANYVGSEGGENTPFNEVFHVGYEHDIVEIGEIDVVKVWEGAIAGGAWVRPEDPDLWSWQFDEKTYADFTLVPESGNRPPVADAGGPYTAEVDVSITFDGTGSRDPDGSIAAYDWDFGDGNTGSGATPSHAYSADGIYYVTLTVTDDAGATDSNGTVAVTGLGNLPPVADAGGQYTGEVDVSITFDGTGSRDPAGSIVAYEWDFGDGNTGSGATPSHAYSANGIYSVILTVTDDAGVTDSDGTAASIAPPSIAPPSNGGDGGNCFITTVTIGASPASHVEDMR